MFVSWNTGTKLQWESSCCYTYMIKAVPYIFVRRCVTSLEMIALSYLMVH